MPLEQGTLTFFAGPMSCGKTLELVRHLQIFAVQQIPLVCLRPSIDTRTPQVSSRSGLLFEGRMVPADDMNQIRNAAKDAQVIGIDEVHMFDPGLMEVIQEWIKQYKIVLLAGLDADFRGLTFPITQALLSFPETNIQRLKAVCSVCRQYNATRTQRLRDGSPVSANDPTILIEGAAKNVTYEARCFGCFELAK